MCVFRFLEHRPVMTVGLGSRLQIVVDLRNQGELSMSFLGCSRTVSC